MVRWYGRGVASITEEQKYKQSNQNFIKRAVEYDVIPVLAKFG